MGGIYAFTVPKNKAGAGGDRRSKMKCNDNTVIEAEAMSACSAPQPDRLTIGINDGSFPTFSLDTCSLGTNKV